MQTFDYQSLESLGYFCLPESRTWDFPMSQKDKRDRLFELLEADDTTNEYSPVPTKCGSWDYPLSKDEQAHFALMAMGVFDRFGEEEGWTEVTPSTRTPTGKERQALANRIRALLRSQADCKMHAYDLSVNLVENDFDLVQAIYGIDEDDDENHKGWLRNFMHSMPDVRRKLDVKVRDMLFYIDRDAHPVSTMTPLEGTSAPLSSMPCESTSEFILPDITVWEWPMSAKEKQVRLFDLLEADPDADYIPVPGPCGSWDYPLSQAEKAKNMLMQLGAFGFIMEDVFAEHAQETLKEHVDSTSEAGDSIPPRLVLPDDAEMESPLSTPRNGTPRNLTPRNFSPRMSTDGAAAPRAAIPIKPGQERAELGKRVKAHLRREGGSMCGGFLTQTMRSFDMDLIDRIWGNAGDKKKGWLREFMRTQRDIKRHIQGRDMVYSLSEEIAEKTLNQCIQRRVSMVVERRKSLIAQGRLSIAFLDQPVLPTSPTRKSVAGHHSAAGRQSVAGRRSVGGRQSVDGRQSIGSQIVGGRQSIASRQSITGRQSLVGRRDSIASVSPVVAGPMSPVRPKRTVVVKLSSGEYVVRPAEECRCWACDFELEPIDRFCTKCGTAVTAPPRVPQWAEDEEPVAKDDASRALMGLLGVEGRTRRRHSVGGLTEEPAERQSSSRQRRNTSVLMTHPTGSVDVSPSMFSTIPAASHDSSTNSLFGMDKKTLRRCPAPYRHRGCSTRALGHVGIHSSVTECRNAWNNPC